MKRKEGKKNGAEFPYILYFPRRQRELSKQDGIFHGILTFDAYAPRTRESALSWLEKGKKELKNTSGWDRGVRSSYYQRKHFLKDPKSQYCVDFEAFIKDVLRYAEEEDWDAFLKAALAFFDKYPIFEGAYGWVPWMARGITITPVCLACWNCTTVTPCSAENFEQEPHCCDKPQIEPFCDVTLHYIGAFGLTKRRMRDLKDPVAKRLGARFEGCWDLREFARVVEARLQYGEKSGTRQVRLERNKLRKMLQRQIEDRIPYYKEEITKAVKNPRYDSPVIRRLRKKYRDLARTGRALLEEIVQQDLDECTREHPDLRFPSAATLLKRGRRGSR